MRITSMSSPMQAMRDLEERLTQLGFLDEPSQEVPQEPAFDDINLAEEIMIMEVIFIYLLPVSRVIDLC